MKKIIIGVACLLSALVWSQNQDVVVLKNGSSIKGIITEMNPGENISIETNDGYGFVFRMKDVHSIRKDNQDDRFKQTSPPEPAPRQLTSPAPQTAQNVPVPQSQYGTPQQSQPVPAQYAPAPSQSPNVPQNTVQQAPQQYVPSGQQVPVPQQQYGQVPQQTAPAVQQNWQQSQYVPQQQNSVPSQNVVPQQNTVPQQQVIPQQNYSTPQQNTLQSQQAPVPQQYNNGTNQNVPQQTPQYQNTQPSTRTQGYPQQGGYNNGQTYTIPQGQIAPGVSAGVAAQGISALPTTVLPRQSQASRGNETRNYSIDQQNENTEVFTDIDSYGQFKANTVQSSTTKPGDCSENVGNFCFINQTNKNVVIAIQTELGDGYYGDYKEMTLKARSQGCFNKLPAKDYPYFVKVKQTAANGQSSYQVLGRGKIEVNRCKNEFITIH